MPWAVVAGFDIGVVLLAGEFVRVADRPCLGSRRPEHIVLIPRSHVLVVVF